MLPRAATRGTAGPSRGSRGLSRLPPSPQGGRRESGPAGTGTPPHSPPSEGFYLNAGPNCSLQTFYTALKIYLLIFAPIFFLVAVAQALHPLPSARDGALGEGGGCCLPSYRYPGGRDRSSFLPKHGISDLPGAPVRGNALSPSLRAAT